MSTICYVGCLYNHAVIIQEIGIGGERVEELLNQNKGKLDVQFLNQALEFATRMDSDVNIGTISLFHVGNNNDCIQLAEREGKHRAYVMLSLIAAALSGNIESINRLSLEPYLEEYNESDDPLSLVHCDLFSIDVSSKVPIEIAQQSDQIKVVNELLLRTNVCPDEGYVYWVGLQLQAVDVALLQEIHWVKKLRLARNKLATLPEEMKYYLQQVYHYKGHKPSKVLYHRPIVK